MKDGYLCLFFMLSLDTLLYQLGVDERIGTPQKRQQLNLRVFCAPKARWTGCLCWINMFRLGPWRGAQYFAVFRSLRSQFQHFCLFPVSCVGPVTPTACSGFLCDGGTLCLPSIKHCDGYIDCRDKTDESTCGEYRATQDQTRRSQSSRKQTNKQINNQTNK